MTEEILKDCSTYFPLSYSFPLSIMPYTAPVFIFITMSGILLYRSIHKALTHLTEYFHNQTPDGQKKIVYHYMRTLYLSILFIIATTSFTTIWYYSATASITCSPSTALFSIIACAIVYTIFLLDILINPSIYLGILGHHIATSLAFCYYMIVGMHDRGFVLIAIGYALYESLCMCQSITLISRRVPVLHAYQSRILFANLVSYALRVIFQLVYIPFVLTMFNELFTSQSVAFHVAVLVLQTSLNARIWYIFYILWRNSRVYDDDET